MDKERPVWVPDNKHGFSLGKIVDIGSDSITVELVGSKGQVRSDSFLFNKPYFRPSCNIKLPLLFLTDCDVPV